MEWNRKSDRFEKCSPVPSPKIQVKVGLLRDVHSNFGVNCKGEFSTKTIDAIADTGCQTTTSGIGLLNILGMSENMLVPTKHRIVGITDTRLEIIGSVFIRIEYNEETTKQMVHISRNSSGLYLSEHACKELNIVHPDFPHSPVSCISAASEAIGEEIADDCKCIPRTDAPERPENIPFPPTAENKKKLKDWLIKHFESSAFNTCSHQPLKCMKGKPMHINFKEGAEPYRVHTPIQVPHHWSKAVKNDMDKDVRLGIIEPVPQGTPTEWCSRMVVAAKKSGDPRRTVDMQQLNKATLRETHPSPTPFSIVSVTPTNTYKTVLDAWNGYHALSLAEDSKDATTFVTEWGRYRYCRAPQGFHASGDAYTRRFDDITADVERVARCIDDSLLWDYGIEDSFWHTYDYLKHCSDNGIVFNVKKFVFAEEICEFAGFELTPDGYRPPKRMLDSIRSFPTPTNITDVKSWFGVVNQVAYAFSMSTTMAPFRDLLKKNNTKFYWDDQLEKIFNESKDKIVDMIRDGVCTFEKDRVTCLSTDWSKVGIGYTLSQKHCECPVEESTQIYTPNCGKGHWRLVLAGSRFTKPAESRYAPIEGEALAVAYALQQCRVFVLGSPNLIVAVDHKPLTRILNDRSLESIENPRILRIKEKTLAYNFQITHVPGNSNMAPDATSRYPSRSSCAISTIEEEDEIREVEDCAKAYASQQGGQLPGSITWKDVNHESNFDEEVAQLRDVIETGFPKTRNELPENMRGFHQMNKELYVIDNAVFRGKKMLIPKKLRASILDGLHAAHQGVSSMKSNARERFFWLGLDADIRQRREQCRICTENAPSQSAEPLILTPPSEIPFQQVAVDFYHAGNHNYLIYADRYTCWTEVAVVPNTSFNVLKKNMITWFRTYGVPEEISSDGGPPFNSADYNEFLKCWRISKRLSSAYYPQSNGRAEVAVKTMKRALNGNVNPRTGDLNDTAALAIMTHRNTPNQETGISPAELLFGYKLRDHLPNKFRSIRKEWKDMHTAKEIANSVKSSKLNSNARTLTPLKKGDSVSIQNQHGNRPGKWSNTGIIMEVRPNRQYGVMMDGSRQITLRNRKFLKRIIPELRKTPAWYNTLPPPPPCVEEDASTPTQPELEVSDLPMNASPRNTVVPVTPVRQVEMHPMNNGNIISPVSIQQPEASQPSDVVVTPETHAAPPQRQSRALKKLQDHNKRGTMESPLQQSAMPSAGSNQVLRRSSRARKQPDRLSGNN